jgi:hypothetical protein
LEIISTQLHFMELLVLDEDMILLVNISLTKEYEAITDQLETEMDDKFQELTSMDVKNE